MPAEAGVPNAAARAVKALGDFIASGFDNPYKLRNDRRLDPIRDREDFRGMVEKLKTGPATPPKEK